MQYQQQPPQGIQMQQTSTTTTTNQQHNFVGGQPMQMQQHYPQMGQPGMMQPQMGQPGMMQPQMGQQLPGQQMMPPGNQMPAPGQTAGDTTMDQIIPPTTQDVPELPKEERTTCCFCIETHCAIIILSFFQFGQVCYMSNVCARHDDLKFFGVVIEEGSDLYPIILGFVICLWFYWAISMFYFVGTRSKTATWRKIWAGQMLLNAVHYAADIAVILAQDYWLSITGKNLLDFDKNGKLVAIIGNSLQMLYFLYVTYAIMVYAGKAIITEEDADVKPAKSKDGVKQY